MAKTNLPLRWHALAPLLTVLVMFRALTSDTGFLPPPVEVFVLVASLAYALAVLLWPPS